MRSQISGLLKEKNPDNISIAEDINNAMTASKRGKLEGLTNIEAAVERLWNINWQYRFKEGNVSGAVTGFIFTNFFVPVVVEWQQKPALSPNYPRQPTNLL